MMWSKLTILVFVGLAFGSQNPGWKPNTEYTYDIRARTLASLHEVADQYTGVLLRAQLSIFPQSDSTLFAKLQNVRFAKVHSQLHEGWLSHIDDTTLSYNNMPISQKQFQIVMKDGVITDVIVEKDVSNWEANIIKSIVSQYQLDVYGKNVIPSYMNTVRDNSETAVFKTMEETITGKTETLYDIHELPEYVLEAKPWLVRFPEHKADGSYLEIVKSKNFSQTEKRPMYHYGFLTVDDFELASNQMGGYYDRVSETRAVISGKTSHFTVQSTCTVDKIIMSPTLNDKQKGSVMSMVNVTLAKVQPSIKNLRPVVNPVSLGGLVYRYNEPFTADNNVRTRRDVEGLWKPEQPQMSEAPQTPLLPLTVGLQGKSIKQDPNFNIVEKVIEISKQIKSELKSPKQILEQNTLNRYTILTSLIRLMNVNELNLCTKKLYTEDQGDERLGWIAFRDAVAEAGTGPALLIIQDWFQSKKISEEEAALVVAAAAHNARHPTLEYLQSFYKFIISERVMNEKPLNEVGLLAFTNLLRKVTADRQRSYNQYPVHTFGPFYNKETVHFTESTVIPYLTERLRESNDLAESKKIHLYIRALGNVAQPQILKAFEPFLEGKEQASQFQRLMMVVALDKLSETYPKVARNVLFRIYQNAGENQEIRIAAVYGLMRTAPPTDMLQRMAEYTHIDSNEYVNAAVKSTIENAAELEGQEFQYLRSSAQAAKPYLTPKVYGAQYAHNCLRSYVINELQHGKAEFQAIGSEDSLIPKYLRLAARKSVFQNMYMDAMVSSIEELTAVFERKTVQYQQDKEQDELAGSGKFSSDKIARFLDLKSEEREQLEGILNVDLGFIQKLWSMDNHTVEQLPQIIREYQQMLKSGKSFHFTKLFSTEQVAISLPTETGLPFLYTFDTPVAVKIEGQAKASATPEVSSNDALKRPDHIDGHLDIHVHVTARKQGRLSFITPFDHQQYVSGYDKMSQVNIPICVKANWNVKQRQVSLELEYNDKKQSNNLIHYSSWPYTATHDIKSMEPLALRESTTRQIYSKQQQHFEHVIGQHYTGVALRVKINYAQKYMDLLQWGKLLKGQNVALMKLWNENTVEHSEFDVEYLPEQSTTKKVVINAGFEHKYQSESDKSEGNYIESEIKIQQFMFNQRVPEDSKERQFEFLKKIAPGIQSVHTDVLDIGVNFDGTKHIRYELTAAVAKSNVDARSKVLLYYHRNVDQRPQYKIGVLVKNHIENTNGLDLTDSIKQNPIYDSQVQVLYGDLEQPLGEIDIRAKLRRSQERKKYLVETPEYKRCEIEMKQGNHQLPACANMTTRMNLLDQFEIKVQHKNIRPEQQEIVKSIFNAIRINYYPQIEEKSSKNREISLSGNFGRRFSGLNVTIKTLSGETKIKNIYVPEWLVPVVAVHPVFHLRSRLNNRYMGLETYRPICVVDQNMASTFNTKTYPITLGDIWTVMLQYVPKHARTEEQQQLPVDQQLLKNQVENFLVLVRDNQDNKNQKDIKITVDVPQTKGKYLDITLQPASTQEGGYTGSNPSAKVSVNGQPITYSYMQSYDISNGFIQIYSLRNGEVKVEVEDAFYIIYDGQRVKLTTLNGKFRNAVRGLCGQNNGNDNDDFLTADNCIAHKVQDFVKSYQFVENQRRQQTDYKCYDKHVLHANVITRPDINTRNLEMSQQQPGFQYISLFKTAHVRSMEEPILSECLKYQTRYVEQNDQICFTIKPILYCKCQRQETVTKEVEVHCLKNVEVVQIWKKQIDDGVSPDFSHKTPTGKVTMEVPEVCSN